VTGVNRLHDCRGRHYWISYDGWQMKVNQRDLEYGKELAIRLERTMESVVGFEAFCNESPAVLSEEMAECKIRSKFIQK
jgi:hypothetical protein